MPGSGFPTAASSATWTTKSRSTSTAACETDGARASEDAARRIAEAEFGDLAASRRELAAVDQRPRRRARPSADGSTRSRRIFVTPRGRCGIASVHDRRDADLAIGIGASVAIFDVVNGVLLRPLPFGHPDRLVAAWHDMPSIGLMHQPQAPATYFTYQRLARSIEGIGVYREGEVNVADPGGRGDPRTSHRRPVSATLIPVLQVAPLLGRVFRTLTMVPLRRRSC